MKTSKPTHALALAVAVAFMAPAAWSPASAQTAAERHEERRQARQAARGQQAGETTAAQFPGATRDEPDATATRRFARQLEELQTQVQDGEYEAAVQSADAIVADERANEYERAFALQAAGSALINQGDYASATGYMQQALEVDGLPNDIHYQVMYQVAQLHMQDGNYAESLAVVDTLITEANSTDPSHFITKGNALYRLDRFPEAIEALRTAVVDSQTPDPAALQILMVSYAEAGRMDEAVALAEQLHRDNPDDNQTLFNLATIHLQAEQYEAAATLLDDARRAGRLDAEAEYRQLYSIYANIQGQEARTIEVIEDGLAQGILTPNAEVYTALGQSYYFNDQADRAIEAYLQAGSLADNGEPHLNAARLLAQEGRWPEAVEAANQARAKGVRDPSDIDTLLQRAP